MMGVNLDRTVDLTFFIGSGLAAIAGILSGLYYSEIHFIMGVSGGVIGFSAAAIGGLGNVYGAILGGLPSAWCRRCRRPHPARLEFRDVVAFAVVMLFLIVRPSGILGEKSVERVWDALPQAAGLTFAALSPIAARPTPSGDSPVSRSS